VRKHDVLTIAEFGNFTIEAEYFYRIEVPYSNKHSPSTVDDIKIEKIELHIRRTQSTLDRKTNLRSQSIKTVRIIGLLDVPPWLWELLNDHSVLEELDREGPDPDPPDDRDQERTVTADDERDY
jgi:hypothetical protein